MASDDFIAVLISLEGLTQVIDVETALERRNGNTIFSEIHREFEAVIVSNAMNRRYARSLRKYKWISARSPSMLT